MWVKQAERITNMDKMIIVTSLTKETLQLGCGLEIRVPTSIQETGWWFPFTLSCKEKFARLWIKIYPAHYDSPSTFKKSGLNRKHRANGLPDRAERLTSIGIRMW